jgi:hypothetical protein
MNHGRTVVAAVVWVFLAFPALFPRAASSTVFDVSPSVRSWSLGLAGVADDRDPANTYFNPAVISTSQGAFATSAWSKLYTFIADDISTYSVGAGYSFPGASAAGVEFRYGAGIRYNVIDWNEFEARDQYNNYLGIFHPRESSLSLTAGVGGTFRETFHGSAGFSIKPWWYDDGHLKESKTAWDMGLMFKTDVMIAGEMKLSPSVGVSFLNMGDELFFRNNRYGIGAHLEGPRSRYFRERLGVEVPSFEVTALYDIIANRSSPHYEGEDTRGFGGELGVAQVLFLRIGNYGTLGERTSHFSNSTYGVGLGLTLTRGWGRFDYASVPQGTFSERVNKFGLSFGLSF